MQRVQLPLSCNNACVFCAQVELRAIPEPFAPPLPAQLARLQAGQAVAFVGGEPTLHADLPAWVARAAAVAPSVLIQTNARLLAVGELARRLREAGATALEVAVHGDTAALHDYHTGTPGSFAETLAGLQAARAAGLPFALTTVLTRSNWRHATAIVELASAVGATALRFGAVQPAGGALAAAARLVPPVAMATAAVRRAQARAAILGLPCFAGSVPPAHAPAFAGIGPTEAAPPAPAAGTSLRSQPASHGLAPPC